MRIKTKTVLKTLSVLICFFSLNTSAQQVSDFDGVWSGSMTTPEHEYWRVEDFISCWAGCPKASIDLLSALLDDPANDDKSFDELNGQFSRHMREHLASISTPQGLALQQGSTNENNPSINCEDYGYLRQTINPLPVEISSTADTLQFHYEEWGLNRIVYLDGRAFPTSLESSRLGYSIGHMEGKELVIETKGIDAEIYNPFQGGGGHSDQLVGLERYSLNNDATVLTLELTLEDPVTLKEAYVFHKQWLSTPDLKILEDYCTDIPGEF